MKRALGGVVAALVVASSGTALAKPALKHRPGAPAAIRLLQPPLKLFAANPVWLQGQDKLAYLGGQTQGGPSDVIIWNPRGRQMGRATDKLAVRRDLVAASDGRIAYVEPNEKPQEAPLPNDGYKPGLDRIVVFDFSASTRKTIFAAGTVLPGSLAWSPDAARLAFLTYDTVGVACLALQEGDKPLVMTRLPGSYHLDKVLGWAGDHDVLVSGTSAKGTPVLLHIGQAGAVVMPPVNAAKLSPDGQMILDRSGQQGVILRGAGGGSRVLSATATGYAWTANQQGVFLVIGPDVVAFDAKGKIRRHYTGAAGLAPDEMVESPDGLLLALVAASRLSVLVL